MIFVQISAFKLSQFAVSRPIWQTLTKNQTGRTANTGCSPLLGPSQWSLHQLIRPPPRPQSLYSALLVKASPRFPVPRFLYNCPAHSKQHPTRVTSLLLLRALGKLLQQIRGWATGRPAASAASALHLSPQLCATSPTENPPKIPHKFGAAYS